MNSVNALLRIFLLMCLLLPALASAVEAGTVIALSGTVSVLSADGKTRVLQKGSPVNSGETLMTTKGARADVRFSDNSMVQLRSETQFRIDEYAYVATGTAKLDGNERGFFSLLKGGFRTVSGMIGKFRRSNYAVVTPTATIGIRGTDYTASLDDRQGLRVSVARGEIALDNKAGSFAVSEGQAAYVPNADSAPNYMQISPSSAAGAQKSRTGKASVSVNGNTHIEATTSRTTAVASGQGNRAINEAGVIGGD